MKTIWWAIIWLGIIIFLIVVSLWAVEGEERYNRQTREHCQQFKSIPEEHLDRIPDGCVPIYFEGRND